MLTDDAPYRFGVVGPGLQSRRWVSLLDSFGASVWYHSPDGDDISSILDHTDDITPEIEVPYFFDGYTDIVFFAGEADDERHELICESLANDIGVIVEPPLAITTEDAEEIHKVAIEHETPLLTAFRSVHSASYRQVVQWSKNITGPLDLIHVVWAETGWNIDPIWDILPEPMSMLHGFDRDRPDSFRVAQGPGWITLEFSGAGPTDIHLSALAGAPAPEHSIRLLGNTGSVVCRPFQEEALIRTSDGEVIQSLQAGMGTDRSILMFFLRRIKAAKEQGKDLPLGEIGLAVTSILSQVDQVLEGQEV